MAPRTNRAPGPSPKKGDFIAGAGGGGLLVYCAQHFIAVPSISQAAVYACPALSIFFMGAYQKLSAFLLFGWEFLPEELVRKRLLKRSLENVSDCRRQLAIIEADPLATADHKATLRADLQTLESAHFQLRLNGNVKAV